jgi:LCP family protein required for cell wall assembly
MAKRVFVISGIVILTIFIAIAGYAAYLYFSVSKTVDDVMHEDVERTTEKRPISMEKLDPLAFLILGTDERRTERGRTDTIIVLTVNPESSSMKMLSIPRDTRTKIIGRGKLDKINHAHAFGGVPMAIATVENFLDIPIDYYMRVNMQGFKDIVDAVGGVTVNNKFEFTQSNIHFPVGEQRLDGREALAYVRMRKEDPRGDFGRNDRQKEVIQAIIREGAQLSSIPKITSILDAVGKNVKTDINFDEFKTLQENYRGVNKNMETLQLSGTGTKINGIYYFQVTDEERQRVSNVLKAHLGIK